jgi:hypothetical protein
MRDGGTSLSSRIVAHGLCSHRHSPAARLFEFPSTVARAQIIPAGSGERGKVRLMWVYFNTIGTTKGVACQMPARILHAIVSLFAETVTGWSRRNPDLLSAALAFNTLFSLAPLLLLFITIPASSIARR